MQQSGLLSMLSNCKRNCCLFLSFSHTKLTLVEVIMLVRPEMVFITFSTIMLQMSVPEHADPMSRTSGKPPDFSSSSHQTLEANLDAKWAQASSSKEAPAPKGTSFGGSAS